MDDPDPVVAPGPSTRPDEVLVNTDNDDRWNEGDICRVCRVSGDESPLFHPCLCTGSIKYVHQHCLMEWLKYSKKDVCELCNHKFVFRPLYREDMPESLPVLEIVKGLMTMSKRYVRLGLTYFMAIFCWLVLVPLVACRVYRFVFEERFIAALSKVYSLNFSGTWTSLSTERIPMDIMVGLLIVAVFLGTFILLVFLREQIANGPPEMFTLDAVDDDAFPDVDILPENNLLGGNHDHGDPADPPADDAIVIAAAAAAAAALEEDDGGADRIGDDLTWQRLLGLDGSFVFIEHVIWMVSLNVIFIVLCLYMPYKFGENVLHALNMSAKGMYFESIIDFFVGYVTITFTAGTCHQLVKYARLKEMYWVLGFFYLMLKVTLLVALEIFIFPSFCGWWLDVCSLPLTGATLSMRLKTLATWPLSSVFVHWLFGMIDVFYSASFVIVLRHLLRPGVLWFVRDLNDPEFQPIQEMIEHSVLHHFRRLVASVLLLFTIILLVVYLPLKVVTLIVPSVLPYTFSLTLDIPDGEFPIEFILLHIVLPRILEQVSANTFLKNLVVYWCVFFGNILGLKEYLLPADVLADLERDANAAQNEGAAVAGDDDDDDEADSEMEEFTPVNSDEEDNDEDTETTDDEDDESINNRRNQPGLLANNRHGDDFIKPPYFGLRILGLLLSLCLTLVTISFIAFTVPVSLGRVLVYFVLQSKNPNDIYTVALALYIIWLGVKVCLAAKLWLHQGWDVVCSSAALVWRIVIGGLPLAGLIPFLMGVYFHMLVIGPLRVASYQTPLNTLFKDWIMGLVHFKLFCAFVFVGPDWWMKSVFEGLYEDGLRNYSISKLYMQVVLPILAGLSFFLAVPYAFGAGLAYLLGADYPTKIWYTRFSYPLFMATLLTCVFISWQWAKMKRLANKIRNDKYLIGTQLVNFYREGQLKLKSN